MRVRKTSFSPSKNITGITLAGLLVALVAIPLRSAQPQAADAQAVIAFLNQSIVWYHQLASQQQLANEPGDVLYLNDNRQIGDDVVRLSFDFARARAQVLTAQGQAFTSTAESNPTASRYQALSRLVARSDALVKQLQTEAEGIRRQLDWAAAKKRAALQAALAETESEQQLAAARRDTLRTMMTFVANAGAGLGGAGTLQSQIDELARTVPVANNTAAERSATPSTAAEPTATKVQLTATNEHSNQPNGIIDLVSDLIALHRKSQALDNAAGMTAQLAQASKALRTPMVHEAKQLAAQSEQLAAQPDSSNTQALEQQKKQVDTLTSQFKQLSAAMLPLAKQSILLDIYQRNLANWRDSVESEYHGRLKSLILRLVILGIVLGIIAAMSELWKRATFRYVHDVRRRYQFLLLRRIVTWIVFAIVIAAAFATELGTLATFAGLLTAGVAVALQNVILSVAGYFFLIGKYGVRVGDRVQVAGVTGDVIDIGLVRLHLMEISTEGVDTRATGRVVVFSNAVVFQPNAGLFKQIPGTNFIWHELTLTLAADSKYQLVQQRIMEAVNSVYEKYKDKMEGQRQRMEQSLSGISVKPLHPESRLRLTHTGLEVVIRYPLELSSAAQIDDDMARAMLDAIAKEPRLRLVGSGTPNIQAVVEGQPVS